VRAWVRECYDEGPHRELAEHSSSPKDLGGTAHRWIPGGDGPDR
jgi:hypothetical protein